MKILVFLFIFFLPYADIALINIPSVGVGLSVSFVFAIILILLFSFYRIKQYKFKVYKIKTDKILLSFYIILIASILMTYFMPTGIDYFNEKPWIKSIKQIIYITINILIYIYLQVFISKYSRLVGMLKVISIALLLNVLVGFYQVIAYKYSLPYLDFLHNNISIPSGQDQLYNGIKRMAGLSGEPAMFGFVTVSIFIFLFYINSFKIYLFNKRLDRFILLLLGCGIILSTSFAVIFIVIFYIVYLYFRNGFNLLKILKLSLLFTIFIFIMYIGTGSDFIVDRLIETSSGTSYSSMIRGNMFLTGILIFIDYPIFGVGLGNFGFYAPLYSPIELDKFWESMSLFSRLLSETGFLGFIAFLLFIYSHKRLTYDKKSNIINKEVIFSQGLYHSVVAMTLVLLIAIPSLTWMIYWVFLAMLRKSIIYRRSTRK